jgi:hypothetical protein
MRGLSDGVRAAKLAKLVEIEGFEDENALFGIYAHHSRLPYRGGPWVTAEEGARSVGGTTTPDEDKATSSSAARPSVSPTWLSAGRLVRYRGGRT